MIGYTSLGTADLARSVAFYDALFDELGAKQVMAFDDFIVWGDDTGDLLFRSMSPRMENPIQSATV